MLGIIQRWRLYSLAQSFLAFLDQGLRVRPGLHFFAISRTPFPEQPGPYVVGHLAQPLVGEPLAVRRAHRIIGVAHNATGGQVVAHFIADGLEDVCAACRTTSPFDTAPACRGSSETRA